MEVKELGFMGVMSYFQLVIAGMADPRSASNATRYSLKDAVLGAFADFFMQVVNKLYKTLRILPQLGQNQ